MVGEGEIPAFVL